MPRMTVLFIRNMPVDVKAHFKAYCAKRGITMTEAIIKLMRDTINAETRKEAG